MSVTPYPVLVEKKNCVVINYLSLYMHTVYSNQQGSYKLPTKGIKVSGRRDAIGFSHHLRIMYDLQHEHVMHTYVSGLRLL